MTVTDQMGRPVFLKNAPDRAGVQPEFQRIVSLVPSQTELLHDLGLGDRVVGITKFCIHPADWFREKTRVGGTKTLHLDKIAALQPDLILGNKEENDRAQIEFLAERWPVWMSDISTLDHALQMILAVGNLTGTAERAAFFSKKIGESFAELSVFGHKTRVAYLIWRKPFMAAGAGTFIDDLLGRAGFDNVFSEKTRYPEVLLEEIAAAQPAAILLSSEPFPFSEKHFAEIRAACPNSAILIVNGELFSWYGTRLLRSAAYFRELKIEIERAIAANPTNQ